MMARVTLTDRFDSQGSRWGPPPSHRGTPKGDPGVTASLPEISGSSGKLGHVLEKLHRGNDLSQHEVSAALREYNFFTMELDDLRRQTRGSKLKVDLESQAPSQTKTKEPVVLSGDQPSGLSKIEKEKLLHQIEQKNKNIEELNRRLRMMAQSKVRHKDNWYEVSQMVTPTELVDRFCDLYSNEWADAYETLKVTWKDDTKALFTCFRIIRHAYVFCYDLAEDQKQAVVGFSDKLMETMIHPTFTHPQSRMKYKAAARFTDTTQQTTDMARKLIREYRQMMVKESVPGVQELFRKVKLPEIFETGFVTTRLNDFIDKAVEIIWLMCVQDPPMMLYWLETNKQVITEYFNFFDKKGDLVKNSVWPAVFLYENGALLSKGVVQTQ